MGSEKKPLANVTEYWLQEHDPDTLLCWEKEVFTRLRKEGRYESERKQLQKDLNGSPPDKAEDLWNQFVHKCLGSEFDSILDNDFALATRRFEEKTAGDKAVLDATTIRLARTELLCRDVFPYVYETEALACALDAETKALEDEGYTDTDPWRRESLLDQVLQESFEELERIFVPEAVTQMAKWSPPWINQGVERGPWTRTKLDRLHSGSSEGFMSFGKELKGIMACFLKQAFCEYALLREAVRRKNSAANDIQNGSLLSTLDNVAVADNDAYQTIRGLFCQYNPPTAPQGIVQKLPEGNGRRRFRILEELKLRVLQTVSGPTPASGGIPLTEAQMAIRQGGGQFEKAKTAMRAFLNSCNSKTKKTRAVLKSFLTTIRKEKKKEQEDLQPHLFMNEYSLSEIEDGLTAILRVESDAQLAVEVDRLADTVETKDRRKKKKADKSRR